MPFKDKSQRAAYNAAYQRDWQRQPIIKARRKAYRIANRDLVREQKRVQRAGVKPTRPCPEFCEANCGRKARCLDHDHKTGLFRGWLCNQCNLGLGLAKDDAGILCGMVLYLFGR
jgi:Recombination endonuclease VII